jgi:hypothetical protein
MIPLESDVKNKAPQMNATVNMKSEKFVKT